MTNVLQRPGNAFCQQQASPPPATEHAFPSPSSGRRLAALTGLGATGACGWRWAAARTPHGSAQPRRLRGGSGPHSGDQLLQIRAFPPPKGQWLSVSQHTADEDPGGPLSSTRVSFPGIVLPGACLDGLLTHRKCFPTCREARGSKHKKMSWGCPSG